MAYELIYTSAPKGLTPGSSGFCIVACTKGINQRLTVILEGLSAYQPLYSHYAENAMDNPISRSHYLYSSGTGVQHILSRICFNGVDHTQRSNKLASHLVLTPAEVSCINGGAASVLLHDEFFKDASWKIEASFYPEQLCIPAIKTTPVKCSLWKQFTGDAGWGGFLAQTYLDNPKRNVYLAYRPEHHNLIIKLFQEAIALLPEKDRWNVSFNTYFTALPAGMECNWRGCPVDSDALKAARRSPGNIIIDLTAPQPLSAVGPLIDFARSGKAPELPQQQSGLSDECTEADFEIPRKKYPVPSLSLPKQHSVPQRVHSHRPPITVSQATEIPTSRKKNIFYIAGTAIIVLGLFIGSIIFLQMKKQEEFFQAKKADFQKLQTRYEETQKEYKESRRNRSSKSIDQQLQKNKELCEEFCAIYDSAIPLEEFQELFLKKKCEHTPKRLLDDCKGIVDGLLIEQEDLERRKKAELKKINEKKKAKVAQKETPPPAAAPATPAPKVVKSPQPSKQIVHIKSEDHRYSWEKRDAFHNLEKNGSVIITVGSGILSEKIGYQFLKSEREAYEKGKTFEAPVPNLLDNYPEYEISYKNGKVHIINKNGHKPNQDTEILIWANNKKFPLFFKLEVSKLRQKAKPEIEIKDYTIAVRLEKPETPQFVYDGFTQIKFQKVTHRIDISTHKIILKEKNSKYEGSVENEKLKKFWNEKEEAEKSKNSNCEKLKSYLQENFETYKSLLDTADKQKYEDALNNKQKGKNPNEKQQKIENFEKTEKESVDKVFKKLLDEKAVETAVKTLDKKEVEKLDGKQKKAKSYIDKIKSSEKQIQEAQKNYNTTKNELLKATTKYFLICNEKEYKQF